MTEKMTPLKWHRYAFGGYVAQSSDGVFRVFEYVKGDWKLTKNGTFQGYHGRCGDAKRAAEEIRGDRTKF